MCIRDRTATSPGLPSCGGARLADLGGGRARGEPPALVRHALMGCAVPVGTDRIDGAGVQQESGSTIAESEECESTQPPDPPPGLRYLSRWYAARKSSRGILACVQICLSYTSPSPRD